MMSSIHNMIQWSKLFKTKRWRKAWDYRRICLPCLITLCQPLDEHYCWSWRHPCTFLTYEWDGAQESGSQEFGAWQHLTTFDNCWLSLKVPKISTIVWCCLFCFRHGTFLRHCESRVCCASAANAACCWGLGTLRGCLFDCVCLCTWCSSMQRTIISFRNGF